MAGDCIDVCGEVVTMLIRAGLTIDPESDDHNDIFVAIGKVKFVPIGSVAVTGMHAGSEEERRQSRPDDTT